MTKVVSHNNNTIQLCVNTYHCHQKVEHPLPAISLDIYDGNDCLHMHIITVTTDITTTHYTCPRAAPTLPVPSIIPVTDDNASLSPFNAGYNKIHISTNKIVCTVLII